MGNKLCLNQQSQSKQLQLKPVEPQQSPRLAKQQSCPLSVEETLMEQSPTPLKEFFIHHKNDKMLCASNNLAFSCKGSPEASKGKLTEEIIMTKPKMKGIKQNQNKRCSIDRGMYYQFQSTIKDYVVTEKTMRQQFGRIQIHQEKFITLRHQNIKDHYRFLEIIGEGSYGSVYRAICIESGEERAIKIIKKNGLAQSKKHEVFAQLQLLKKMDHPNIIKLYQVFQSKQRYQVVTQYCKGGSIIDFIKERQHFDESTVKIILKQLLGCLNYLHTLKIVHRDIKLQNIVFINKPLKSNEIHIQIKLLDFGTAYKMVRPKVRCSDLVGTISYIAPQIVKGYFTDKCDLWSCGVILHILLTSKSPFKCKKRQDTLKKILHHAIDYNSLAWNDITDDARDLVKKLLEKDPYRRLSADHALKHRWFQTDKQNLLKNSQFVKSLTNYYRQNNLISVLESYLIFSKVSQDQRNRINLLFKQLDENSDGFIQKNQLIEAYRIANSGEANLDEIQYILNKIDKDNSGCINLNQFSSVMVNREKLFVKDALSSAFDYFAKGTGFIQMKQLSELLQGSDSKQIEMLLSELDQNRDKKISRSEFLNYLLKKGCLY